jgi:hypothetical protein
VRTAAQGAFWKQTKGRTHNPITVIHSVADVGIGAWMLDFGLKEELLPRQEAIGSNNMQNELKPTCFEPACKPSTKLPDWTKESLVGR